MTPEALIPSLVAGQFHAITDTFQTEFPTLKAQTQKVGKEATSILFSDYGVDILSNGLIARDDTIANYTDRTRRWVDSTMRAFAWAVENPDEALRIFIKHNPAIDPKLARAHWEIAVDHLLVPEAKEQGIGFMPRERVAYARDLLTRLMKLEKEVPVEELYDLRFLPKLFPKRGPRAAF
jgi:NitT/TauT family transport system substrate-binding protein